MGYLYQPTLKSGGAGRIYWAKYYVNGRPIRESTGCAKEKDARDFLKRREGAVATGAPIAPRVDRLRYEELAEDLRRYYATTGKRGKVESETRFAHLDRFFAQIRIVSITPALVSRYVEERQRERPGPADTVIPGASNGTINRELGVLSRMLRLGYKHGKVLRLPVVEKLAEAPPRAGFFEEAQFDAVCRHLPPDLQVAATIAYTFGWRTQSEILTREWRHVDLEAGTLRLDPGEAKNGDGRIVYLTPALAALLATQRARVDGLQRRLGRIIPAVFPHPSGRRAGERRQDYRKAWATACRAAGVAGRIRHDFRRTAVRNMERAGVPRSVATKLTGHKTESVYRRYAIVSDIDLKQAAQRLAGTFSGTFGPVAEKGAAEVVRI